MGRSLNDVETLEESGIEVKGTLHLKLLADQDDFFISDFLPPDAGATMEVEMGFAGTVLGGGTSQAIGLGKSICDLTDDSPV
jgi:hypothetical protein